MKSFSAKKLPKTQHQPPMNRATTSLQRGQIVQALISSAKTLHMQGHLDRAESAFLEVLKLDEGNYEVLQLLGMVAGHKNNPSLAVEYFDRALRIKPDYAKALKNRGIALQELKRFDDALASYDKALTLKPDYFEANYSRGNLLADLGRWTEALVSYDRVLAIDPGHAETHYNRGLALQLLARPDEALASYGRALSIRPEYVEAHINRGNVLKDLRRLDEALASYDRALSFRPEYVDAHVNRGAIFQGKNRQNDALKSFAQALAIDPDHAIAHYNESLSRLVMGDFAIGWQKYEYRWSTNDHDLPRDYVEPLWLGDEDLRGKRIFLYAEQGLGDVIQFCRYGAKVSALGAHVILGVQPALKSLLQDLEGINEVVSEEDELPPFDFHCPLLSLPLAFRADLSNITGNPYLAALPEKVADWRKRLGQSGFPRVGLVWSGNVTFVNDHNRSLPLVGLVDVLAPGIDYICLQKEIRDADQEILQQHPEIRRFDAELNNFSETAALIEAMDVVISVDTSVAHLAGALGKEVWILLPFAPDWRWLLDRTDSPWYDSARLIRQSRIGDWTDVLQEVKQRLKVRFGV